PRAARAQRGCARRASAVDLDLDDAVLDAHGKRVDGEVGRQRQRPTRADVEPRAVARADNDALVGLPVALAQWSVVVRAAVLEGKELAAAVVHADLDQPGRHDLDRPGRQLLERTDLDLHARETR